MFREYVEKKFNSLRKGSDKQSNEVLDYAVNCLMCESAFRNFLESKRINFPEFHRKHELLWKSEKKEKNLTQAYPGIPYLAPEVFYFHHGLRFGDKRIADYVKNKDFLDCGAFVGDSVLVLRNYEPKMIYCYEFSKQNIEGFKKTMRLNGITSGYKLIPEALGDKVGQILVNTEKIFSGERLKACAEGYPVNVTTIDEEAEKHNLNPGFLKIDVEGAGMAVIKGAINTIKKHRPVMSVAVYHNSEELFGIKPFLESQLKDYVFEFHFLCFELGNLTELTLFCYPKEITTSPAL